MIPCPDPNPLRIFFYLSSNLQFVDGSSFRVLVPTETETAPCGFSTPSCNSLYLPTTLSIRGIGLPCGLTSLIDLKWSCWSSIRLLAFYFLIGRCCHMDASPRQPADGPHCYQLRIWDMERLPKPPQLVRDQVRVVWKPTRSSLIHTRAVTCPLNLNPYKVFHSHANIQNVPIHKLHSSIVIIKNDFQKTC